MRSESEEVERIGRYELIRKIAVGGMAELYLARTTGPGGFEKRCAIKRILPQFAHDAEFTRMFLAEARVAAMFNHPNLVQIFELAEDETTGRHFIAMELIEGFNLRQLVATSRSMGAEMTPEIVAYIATQVLDGLVYVHEFCDASGQRMNLVHRDVSPQNILASFDGAIKLVDFGILKTTSAEGHTQTGMLKGKVAYMAPEQATGVGASEASDLFSLGVVMYELIGAKKPFRGANELMTLKAIVDEPPERLASVASACPPAIEAIVHRALAKQRSERYATAREMRADLMQVLRHTRIPIDREVFAAYLRSSTDPDAPRFDVAGIRIATDAPLDIAPLEDESFRREAAATFQAALVAPTMSDPGTEATLHSVPDLSHDAASERRKTSENGEANDALDEDFRFGLGRAMVGRRGGLALAGLLVALVLTVVLVWQQRQAPGTIAAVPLEVAPSIAPAGVQPLAAEAPTPAFDDHEPANAVVSPPKHEPNQATPAAMASGASRDEPAVVQGSDDKRRATSRQTRQTPARGNNVGRLIITSTPRNLVVLYNDRVLGRTPLDVSDLSPGPYALVVTNERLGILRKLNVDIRGEETTRHEIVIQKALVSVNSRPWADVYIDDRHVGRTPLRAPVYEGRHRLRLVNPDEGERIQVIDIAAGEEKDVRVKF